MQSLPLQDEHTRKTDAGESGELPEDGERRLAGLAVETLSVPWREELSAAGLRARMATYSAYAVMPDDERTKILDVAAAVLNREADRSGASVVPFDHITFGARA